MPEVERLPRLHLCLGLLLTAVTLAVFGQMLGHQFIVYDDGAYVTGNCHVRAGHFGTGICWAFATMHAGNWHPVTWLSHMLDCTVYGLNPLGHHLTSLLIHLASVLLLFVVLGRMTRSPWKSALVAALFAIHPLHVESVAWIAERKDVLSTFFGLLTMWAYVRYSEFKVQGSRFKVGAYAAVMAFFALGLMAKPMLVTLPFVLLLLDYWPLRRVGAKHLQSGPSNSETFPANALPLLVEKIPLFALSAASCIVTYYAQHRQGAVGSWDELPLVYRAANALVSYTAYIGKMLWPRDLAIFYPHPGSGLPLWQVLGAAVLLAGITVVVLRAARSRPYLAVGWLWYVGTLAPVIGLVQVGSQAMADRYTYLPLIGLFVVAAWGLPDLLNGRMGERGKGRAGSPIRPSAHSPILPFAGATALLALAVCACIQTGYWENSIRLFERALAVTEPNAVAHNSLGSALEAEGSLDEAGAHFARALDIRPRYAEAHYHMGVVLHKQGRLDEAMEHYRKAAEIKPCLAEVYVNMGAVCVKQRRLDDAIAHYLHAIRLDPDQAQAYENLAVALYCKGDYAGAWDGVCRCRKLGGSLHPGFIQALAQRMPEP